MSSSEQVSECDDRDTELSELLAPDANSEFPTSLPCLSKVFAKNILSSSAILSLGNKRIWPSLRAPYLKALLIRKKLPAKNPRYNHWHEITQTFLSAHLVGLNMQTNRRKTNCHLLKLHRIPLKKKNQKNNVICYPCPLAQDKQLGFYGTMQNKPSTKGKHNKRI
jgi:hypothetical protein